MWENSYPSGLWTGRMNHLKASTSCLCTAILPLLPSTLFSSSLMMKVTAAGDAHSLACVPDLKPSVCAVTAFMVKYLTRECAHVTSIHKEHVCGVGSVDFNKLDVPFLPGLPYGVNLCVFRGWSDVVEPSFYLKAPCALYQYWPNILSKLICWTLTAIIHVDS